MSIYKILALIPAYNESARLAVVVAGALVHLPVLVVDDGSSDDTAAVAEGAGAEVWRQTPNQGKGAAIRRGMAEARGRWRLFTDADNSTPIAELDKFWGPANEGFDVVIASRALPESRLELRQPLYREMMGRCFNRFVQALAISGIRDTQCGFKLFSQDASRAVFPRQQLPGWTFDVECLMIARGLGFRIAEVPVRWINSPATRIRALSDSLRMFRDLWRLRRKYGKDGARITK